MTLSYCINVEARTMHLFLTLQARMISLVNSKPSKITGHQEH
jgi:hypothetical protein